MKRQPPFEPGFAGPVDGIWNSDPDALYVNGDPSAGTEGSIPPMEAVDHPQREVVDAIAASGQTPSVADLQQLARALAIMPSRATFGVCSGTANDYEVALPAGLVKPTAPFTGMVIRTVINVTNTGATVANVFGYGDKKVLLFDGSALEGNELAALVPTQWQYDAAADGGDGAWLLAPWANARRDVHRELYWDDGNGTSYANANFVTPLTTHTMTYTSKFPGRRSLIVFDSEFGGTLQRLAYEAIGVFTLGVVTGAVEVLKDTSRSASSRTGYAGFQHYTHSLRTITAAHKAPATTSLTFAHTLLWSASGTTNTYYNWDRMLVNITEYPVPENFDLDDYITNGSSQSS